MKGALGLTIAAGLGIVGAICNWLYLQQLASEQETVSLIGVKPGVQLNIGDPFEEADLEPVPIPRDRAGNLIERAPLWSALSAVQGYSANRVFHGGEILLNDDLEAPAVRNLAETLQDDEVARWVPIDTRAVVTEQINPGDMVSFDVSSSGESKAAGGDGTRDASPGGSRIIGPFRVLALGSRREPTNISQSTRPRGGSAPNTIAIVVKLKNGEYEPSAAELFDALRSLGTQGVGVQLHSSRTKDTSRAN
jgi:Flp pilus assembly protein CpaB